MSTPTSSTSRKLKAEIAQIAKTEAAKTSRKVAKQVALGTSLNDDFNPDTIDDDGGEDNRERELENFDSVDPAPLSSLFQDRPTLAQSSRHHIPEQEGDDRDVFEIGNEKMRAGTPVNFFIKRNGMYVHTADAPYTISQLQSDFGGGAYSVDCRNADNGQLVTRKKFSVAPPIAKINAEKVSEQTNNLESITRTFADQQRELAQSSNEMVKTILEEKRRDDELKKDREEKEAQLRKEYEEKLRMEAKENQSTLASVLTALLTKPAPAPVDNSAQFMTALQSMQQANQQQMQMLMQQMTSTIEKVSTNTSHAIEKVSENTKHMVEKLSEKIEGLEKNKPKGMFDDPFTLFEFLDGVKTKEYERGKEIGELVAGQNSDPKEKSIIETAIESLGKVMPALIMSQQNQPAPAPYLAPTPMIPRQTPAQLTQNRPAPRKVTPSPVGQAPVVVRSGAVATPKVAQNPTNVIIPQVDKSQIVVDVCKNVIGQGILAQTPPAQVAQNAVVLLNQRGVTIGEALSLVKSVEELWVLAENVGLPMKDPEHGAALREYLKGFYDCMAQLSASESRQTA